MDADLPGLPTDTDVLLASLRSRVERDARHQAALQQHKLAQRRRWRETRAAAEKTPGTAAASAAERRRKRRQSKGKRAGGGGGSSGAENERAGGHGDDNGGVGGGDDDDDDDGLDEDEGEELDRQGVAEPPPAVLDDEQRALLAATLRHRLLFAVKRRLSAGTTMSGKGLHGRVIVECTRDEFTSLFPNRAFAFRLAGDDALEYFNERLGLGWNRLCKRSGETCAAVTAMPDGDRTVSVRWFTRCVRDYSDPEPETIATDSLSFVFEVVRGRAAWADV